jgi:surface carbohydrate biosynthesis protein
MGFKSNPNITYQKKYDILFKRRAKFINTIKNIVLNNPKKNFLLRPNPYEEIKIYKDLIVNCPNLKLDTSSNSIDNCKLLIHLDCTTAVEAFFLKKPVISLKYILDKNDQNMYYKITHHVGLLAKNEKEVIELIKRNNLRNKNLFRCNKKIISEIFRNQSSISNFVSEIKKIYIKKDKT